MLENNDLTGIRILARRACDKLSLTESYWSTRVIVRGRDDLWSGDGHSFSCAWFYIKFLLAEVARRAI
jgi:hypothetical protein